jgi:hypothetical protein
VVKEEEAVVNEGPIVLPEREFSDDGVSDEGKDEEAPVIDEFVDNGGENLHSATVEENVVYDGPIVLPEREVPGNEVCEVRREVVDVPSAIRDDSPPTPIVLDHKLANKTIPDDATAASSREPQRQRRDKKSKDQRLGLETPEKPQPAQSPKVTATSPTPPRHDDPTAITPATLRQKSTAPFIGPPRPPASSSTSKKKPQQADPDKLFMEM